MNRGLFKLGIAGLLLSVPATFAASPAVDTASNSAYSDGWQSGDNGGFGFSGWTLSTAGSGSGGHFIGTGHSAFGTSWGMFANGGKVTEAIRPFTGSLSINQTFSVSMDNGSIDSGGTVGLGLQNSSGTNRIEFFFVGGDSSYKYFRPGDSSGTTTGISFTSNGLRIFVTPVTTTTLRLQVMDASQTNSLFNQVLTVANAGDISQVRLFNANAGSGSGNDAFFDDVATPEPVSAVWVIAAALVGRRQRPATRRRV